MRHSRSVHRRLAKPARSAGRGLPGLMLLVLAAGLAGGPAVARPAAPSQPSTPEPAQVTLHLPLISYGWLALEVPLAATAQARAATQTARARPSRTATATASPEASATASPTTLPTPTFRPTVTSTASATALRSPTPSATATGPTPTPSTTATSSATATASATPTITPTPTPRDPGVEGLRPRAAEQPGRGEVRYDRVARAYRLTHRGTITQTWELDLDHPDNQRGRLTLRQVESGRYPLAGAGLHYRDAEGRIYEPRLLGSVGAVTAITHSLLPAAEGPGFSITVTEDLEGRFHEKRYRLRLVGRAIELRAQSLDGTVEPGLGGYAGFSAGDIEGSQDALGLRLPYMDAVPVTMLDHRWFVSGLLDQPRSQASALLPRGPEILPGAVANELVALYLPDSEGRTRAVDERLWVTLSPHIEDLFAQPDGEASRHRASLTGRVHLQLEGRGDRPEEARAEAAWLEELRQWGVTDLQVHRRDWRDPAMLLPSHRPAEPEAAFDDLAAAARGRLAASLALTRTVAPCPGQTNPGYDPAERVIGADGLPKPDGSVACPGGGRTEAWLLAPDGAARLATAIGRELRDRGVGAIGLEEIAAYSPGMPWAGAFDTVVDRSPRPRHPATVGEAIATYKRLFQSLQIELGPVFGSGSHGLWERGYDSFYAGYLDGAARSLSTGSTEQPAGDPYLVLPDYELRVVRPRMLGYGMGDYARFFDAPPAPPLDAAQIDSWRATTLAYGHAAAWALSGAALARGDDDYLSLSEQVKAYYLMRALQQRYLDAELLTVGYLGAEGEQDLSGALRLDYDLAQPRLHLTYRQAGQPLELWINHGRDPWSVEAGGQGHLLPQHGWLARGPEGLLAYSALVEGQQVDYLRAPELVLMDGRGRTTDFEGQRATDLLVRWPDGRAIVEGPNGSLSWREP